MWQIRRRSRLNTSPTRSTHRLVVDDSYRSAVYIGDVSDGAAVKLLDFLNNLSLIKDYFFKNIVNVNLDNITTWLNHFSDHSNVVPAPCLGIQTHQQRPLLQRLSEDKQRTAEQRRTLLLLLPSGQKVTLLFTGHLFPNKFLNRFWQSILVCGNSS